MKRLIASLCLLSCGAKAESIFPDNNLHLYDSLNAETGIQESTFNQIINAAADSYQAEATQRNERLIIHKRWTDKTVNANVSRSAKYGGAVTINMFGGLARRQEMTPAGFAIVLCHELGHAYAGKPFVHVPTELSAEGMADWYSTRHCLKRVWERVPRLQEMSQSYEGYIEENCIPDDSLCRNGLEGAHGLTKLLDFLLGSEEIASFETPDPTVVTRTVLSYPATVQCRLDSYVAGVFGQAKPRCWFAPAFTSSVQAPAQ